MENEPLSDVACDCYIHNSQAADRQTELNADPMPENKGCL